MNIPVYEAFIDNDDLGVYKVSLVDSPAVLSDFVYFNKETKKVNFAIENEEQRMVTGVIMRADFPIYRYSEEIGEYYMKFSKETIKKMAKKMMEDYTFNNINLQHEDGTDVKGVNLVELFIKDTEKGISPKGFEDIEEGSLFATYKVDNDDVWQSIKDGTFKGFSIEAIVDLEIVKFKKIIKENNILNSIMKTFNNFLKKFVKFGSMITDKGELYWVGEADLEIGDELFYNTDDEEAVKVEDGEYKLEDGTVVVVKDGLVSEIRKRDGEQEGELDMSNHSFSKTTKCETQKDETKAECKEEDDETEKEGDKRFDEITKEVEDLKAKIDELKKIIDELKEKPATDPIVEEFENKTKVNGGIPTFGSRSRITRN